MTETSSLIVPGITGMAMGIGLVVIRRAVAPVPPSLSSVLAALDGRRPAPWWSRLPSRVIGTPEDLAITGRSPAQQVARWITVSTATSAVTVLAVVLASVGGVEISPGVAGCVILIASVAAATIAPAQLRRLAAERRRAASQSLSAYLDLVTVLLAGGAGVETALVAAAEIAEGPFFRAIRVELTRSRALRRSPWTGLSDLGRRWGVEDLNELASTVALAGEQGARVRASLMARASSLRDRQLASIEARAQSATERMGVPMVLVFIGFVVLLGYPALALVVGGL